ncbi:MAG: radical SAM protein [Chitinispirillaceae bacterium]|nr:radical SAM protein [Chitinispirillaceae bacterium]
MNSKDEDYDLSSIFQSRENQDLLRASFTNISPDLLHKAIGCFQTNCSLPAPISVHYHLTQRCNCRCVHCKQWSWPKKAELPTAKIKELFSIWKRWGVQTLTLGGGNPLLHSDIDEVLKCAKQKGMSIGLISEGAELPEVTINNISKTVSWVRFSIDGPNPEIHDTLRNCNGLFTLVTKVIEALRHQNPMLTIGINCVIQKGNISNISKMVDLACRLKINTLLFKLPHGRDPQNCYLPSRSEFIEFANWAYTVPQNLDGLSNNAHDIATLILETLELDDIVTGHPVRSHYLKHRVRCFAPLFFLTSDTEGNMYPCDYLHADTRAHSLNYRTLRAQFCLGNVFNDEVAVLKKRNELLHSTIHYLPTQEDSECSSCTRFFQINTALTQKFQDLIFARGSIGITNSEPVYPHCTEIFL